MLHSQTPGCCHFSGSAKQYISLFVFESPRVTSIVQSQLRQCASYFTLKSPELLPFLSPAEQRISHFALKVPSYCQSITLRFRGGREFFGLKGKALFSSSPRTLV